MLAARLLVSLLVTACCCNVDKPLVKTPLGAVQGHFKTSHGGRKFAAFEGIPYAEPPIGTRRFEAPKPIQPWLGVWDATYLTQCAQTSISQVNTIKGTEDCLHINVYVPRQNPNPEEKLDVIIHIPGGAFMYGSGHESASPLFLMDRDVILVTFNYRLGIFGFLSTEDDIVPGNNGLKDQVVALQWTRHNIASFGGNPDSVTLTGSSAGGGCVHFHYLSEMSKGLFHRGFSQSAVSLNPFALQKKSLSKAQRLGEAVGCPSHPTQVLVSCLKRRHFKQLLDQVSLFFEYKVMPFSPFSPVVEKAGSKPFLKAHPYYLLTKGEVLDVPWIMSNSAHEGLYVVNILRGDEDYLNKNWETVAPILLDFSHTLPETKWKSASAKIKEFYLGENQDVSKQNEDKLIQMLTDRMFLVDTEIAVRLQAKVTTSPIYYYHFNYPGDNNELKYLSHNADLKYYFGDILTSKPLTPNELKMSDIFLNMLVSYAKTGVPVMDGVKWKPTKDDKLTYVDINGFEPGEIILKTVDHLTPTEFWKSLEFLENEHLFSVKDEL